MRGRFRNNGCAFVMKKLLALVLALVMTLGLATVGANAAFADADSIEHDEAVEVLNALGIVGGKENNNFDPAANVKRSEMAKMVTIAMLGDVDVSAFQGAPTDLTDINGHWAEGYIKYCVSQGIVGGRGNGKFDPDANVTATEAAKMLLVAIGYNAEVQGYIGDQWKVNVARDAQLSGFYEKLKGLTTDKALTRDETAQMVYNAIDADLIVKTPTLKVGTSEISYTYAKNNNGDDLLSETFGADTLKATFIGNTATLDLTNDGYIDVYDESTGNDYTFPYADLDISRIGEQVKVVYKEGTESLVAGPDKKDTIYGVYVTGATQVYNITANDLQSAGETNLAAGKIKFGDTLYPVSDSITSNTYVAVVYNYSTDNANSKTASDVDDAVGDVATAAGVTAAEFAKWIDTTSGLRGVQNASKIKFTCDENGKIVRMFVTESTLTKVTAVNSTQVSLKNIDVLEIKDNEIYDGAAKNDIVVATLVGTYGTANKGYYLVEKAETVEGEITGYGRTGVGRQAKVAIDGTTYNIEQYALLDLTDDNLDDVDEEVGTSVRAYLLNGMVKSLEKTSATAYNYALVIDSNNTVTSNFATGKLRLLMPDGTKKNFEVHKDSATQATAFNAAAPALIKYSLSSDQLKITAANAVATDAGTAAAWNSDTKVVGGTAVASSDCVLFTWDSGTSYNAYNIRTLKSVTASEAHTYYFANNATGQIVAAYAKVATPVSNSNTMYGMVIDQLGVSKIGSDYYSGYKIWTGEETTVYIEGSASDELAKGAIVSFGTATDSKYAANTEFTALTANGTTVLDVAAKSYNDTDRIITFYQGVTGTAGSYTGANARTLAVDKDVKIVYVNRDTTKAGADVGVNEFSSITGYANVKLVLDNQNVVIAMIVESSGKADVNGNKTAAAFYVDAAALAAASGGDTAAKLEGLLGASKNILLDVDNLTTLGSSLEIKDDESLTITGNLTADQAITVGDDDSDEGGKLVVNGYVTNNGNNITVYGTMSVAGKRATGGGTGNVSIDATSATITVGNATTAGSLTVAGNIYGTSNGINLVNGTVDATDYTITLVKDAKSGTIKGNVGTLTTTSASAASAAMAVNIYGDVGTVTNIQNVGHASRTAVTTIHGNVTSEITNVTCTTDKENAKLVVTGNVADLKSVTYGTVEINGNVVQHSSGTLGVDGNTKVTIASFDGADATKTLALAGGDLSITGNVGATGSTKSNLTIAGTGTVTVGGTVYGDVSSTGATTTLKAVGGTSDAADLTVVSGTVRADSVVNGMLTVTTGTVTVSGKVKELKDIADGTVTIGGDITTFTKISGGTLKLGGKATVVTGTTTFAGTPDVVILATGELVVDATGNIDIKPLTLSGEGNTAKVTLKNVAVGATVTVDAGNKLFAGTNDCAGGGTASDGVLNKAGYNQSYLWDGTSKFIGATSVAAGA